MYDSREAYDATNISIVPPFEKYFTEKTIFVTPFLIIYFPV